MVTQPLIKKRKYSQGKSFATQLGWGSQRPRSAGAKTRINPALASALGVESKYVDNYISSGAIVTTCAGAEQDPAAIGCLNSMTTGDEPTMRNGRKIHMTSVQVRGHVNMTAIMDQPDAWLAPYVRVIVYVDHQTNQAQCNSEDVLDDGMGTDVTSLRNVEYKKRFSVISDQTYMIPLMAFNDAAATGTIAGGSVPFSIYKKLNFDTTFKDGDGNVTSVVDNSVHILAISSTSNCKLHYTARCRFVG